MRIGALLLLMACGDGVDRVEPQTFPEGHCPFDLATEYDELDTTEITAPWYPIASYRAGGPVGDEDPFLLLESETTDVLALRHTLDEHDNPEVLHRMEHWARQYGFEPDQDYPACDHDTWRAHLDLTFALRGRVWHTAGVFVLPWGDFQPEDPGDPAVSFRLQHGVLIPSVVRGDDLVWEEYL